jgi:endonuclease YncB( thermonuclease family)
MLGWRKRNDGFEWRDYVRTTILVRRKQRRDRIAEAGLAAVENLKEAGQRGVAAGAEGAKVVGRGAVNLGHQGAAIGAAGAKAVGEGALHLGKEGAKLSVAGAKLGAAGAMASAERLRAAIPVAGGYLQRVGGWIIYAVAYTWAVLRMLVAIIGDYLGPPLAPVGDFLRRPGIRIAVLVAGSVALLGGIIRAFANGFVTDTLIALIVGAGLLIALALAHASSGLPTWLTSRVGPPLGRLSAFIEQAWARPSVQKGLAIGVLVVAVGFALHAFGFTQSQPDRGSATRASRSERSSPPPAARADNAADIAGRGSAISGDTLRIGTTNVRLNGIEAPLSTQVCNDSAGRPWNCGASARQALSRSLRAGRVSCDLSGSDEPRAGACSVDGRDLAAELVRGGHVFAASGLFAPYGSEEREAKASKSGIWSGENVRPSEYRDQKWQQAKAVAPDGCPIKGSVRGGRRLYVQPWDSGYERVRVVQSRGERWFCSQAEAEAAGFKAAEQS